MSSSAPDKTSGDAPRASEVEVSNDELIVTLRDGRRIAAPLAWYPRLLEAAPKARSNVEILGGGTALHWPEVDEDLSVAGLLEGRPAIDVVRDRA